MICPVELQLCVRDKGTLNKNILHISFEGKEKNKIINGAF